MRIGTIRPEEARVFDSAAGHHVVGEHWIEVFWIDSKKWLSDRPEDEVSDGWYWWFCVVGCLPVDGTVHGPFSRSSLALEDAQNQVEDLS